MPNQKRVLLSLFLLTAAALSAQTTDIGIGTTVLQPSVKRLGINLGTLNNYDSGQILQNLISANPGFEGQLLNSTVQCAYGSATSCTDNDQYSAWTAGFWNGATYEVISGAAIGRTGTVTSSSAPGYGEGVVLNFADSGTAPGAGDYIIVRNVVPGSATAGWSPSTSGNGFIATNLTDLPPGTLGKQTVALSAPTPSDFANLSSYFDSTPGRTFLQLNGSFQLQFKAKGTGGANQVYVKIQRFGGATYINQVVNLTGSWNTYNLTFSASENGSAVGTVGVSFGTVGASAFELDDVSLTTTSGDPSNGTVFRDPVITALRQVQPGVLRYWGGNGHLAETLDNFLAPPFGRQLAGFSAFYSATQADYGLHEFLVLCQTIGAEPWFVVPTTFTTTDASNLIQYLAGATTTPYGAKRMNLGQSAPWTQVFSKIHLEFGNEAWNGVFAGGTIQDANAYGGRAQLIFSYMRSNPAYVPASFDLVLGGQAASPGRNSGIQNACNNNDSFTIAPYTMNQVDSYSSNESLFGPTFAEPEALMSSASSTSAEGLSPGLVYSDYEAIQLSNHPVPVSFYEINLSTLAGSITQTALNSYVSSLGAGLMVADTMLQGMAQYGVVNQQLFALPQWEFTRPDGSSTYLWGAVVDMGVTNLKRPQFLALQLANQALSNGASMLQTVQTGLNPTWNQALVNTVQFTGAHMLQSYAFVNGTNLSAVVFNLSRTSSLPITLSGVNAPAGTVQMQQLTSANPTDTNETSSVVNIVSSTLTNFSGASGLTLPPYSMTVLTWSTSAQPPVISGVLASGVTSNSATVSWTTDQASTTEVQYGTSTAYGSSSALNSSLMTSHSVTLTGLTSGTTYDYAATSANAAGTPTTSANFTFSTPQAAPVISAVTVSAITGSSATITWATDQASTSQAAYGLTTAYGSVVQNAALVTSHSLVLTGLQGSTTYNLAVTSANSAGTPATSANFTFTTAAAPVISAVTATSITATSAVITWTTSQTSSSQVQYGTSVSYSSSSTLNSTLVTAHSISLTGLAPGTVYNYAALSVNSLGLSASSPNFTFTTIAQAPVISAVAAASITNSSAVITWTTSQAASTLVNYGTTTSYGSSSTLNASLVTSHSVTLTGLTQGTTYNYAVVSANAAGNSATSANFTFTTTTPPPVISAVAASKITGTSATITWTTSQTASSLVNYGTTTSYGSSSTLNATLVTSHTVTLTGLTPSTTYDYDVVSANSSGASSTSANFTFSTIAQAPVISAVTVISITSTSASVTWTTDQASSSQVKYGTTTAYGSTTTLNSTLVTSHTVALAGLTLGTTYNFEVVSANFAGTSATSANATFKTSSTGGTGPVISYVADWGITGSGITISWSTDVASTTQVAYGTTTALGQTSPLQTTLTTSHGVTLTGLKPLTSYYFVCQSTGANGVIGYSSATNFTTVSAGPPVISSIVVVPGSGNTAQISWTTSTPATSYVQFGPTTSYNRWSSTTSLTTTPNPTMGYVPSGTIHYQLVSTDASGNQILSPDYTFTEP